MVPWRTVFFAVNFSGSLLVAGICVLGICLPFAGGGSPYGLVIGVILIGPAIALSVAEWLLYARRVKRLERPLGIVSGNAAGVTVFLFAINAANAFANGSSAAVGTWLGIALASLAAAGYGLWCCWLRMNGRTLASD